MLRKEGGVKNLVIFIPLHNIRTEHAHTCLTVKRYLNLLEFTLFELYVFEDTW